MSVSADTLRELGGLGLSIDQIASVVEIMERGDDDRRTKARDKKRQQRLTLSLSVPGQAGTDGDRKGQPSPKETSPAPPKEITPSASLRSDTQPKGGRASRIPQDFVPDMSAAYAAGLSQTEALVEVANFIDYWRAKATNATKLDWQATWRMWCRRAAKDTTNPRAIARGPPQSGNRSGWTNLAKEFERERNGSEPHENRFERTDDTAA